LGGLVLKAIGFLVKKEQEKRGKKEEKKLGVSCGEGGRVRS